ncbi:MAG: carboxymuconolactone decarboxylase family protein [Polaromonas sp.]
MTSEQRAIQESILATRGSLDGPFFAWMHSPGLANAAEKLGAFCRYGSSLPLRESELLILLVAAHHRCIGEQQIHEPIARKSGWSADVVAAIREQRTLPTLDSPRADALAALARELLQTHRIGAACYEQALSLLGAAALVETVGVIGYYALVAHTLNAFEMTQNNGDTP